MPEGDFRNYMKAVFSSAPGGSCPPEWKLVAWEDGRLGPDDRLPVSEHIDGCPLCRSAIGDIKALFSPGVELPPPEMESDWIALQRRLRAEETGSSVVRVLPRRRYWSAVATAAAAMLLLVSVFATVSSLKWKARLEALQSETSGRLLALERDNRALQSKIVARNSEPQVNAPVVDLFPRDAKDRSAQGSRLKAVDVPANSVATIVLYLRDGLPGLTYSLQISDTAAHLLWQGSGLTRGSDGALTVTIPGSFLADGEYTLRLLSGEGAGAPRVAEYRLQWRRSGIPR